jgi:hypothetical protein
MQAAGSSVKTTIRNLTRLDLSGSGGGEITFTVDEDLAATVSANPNKGSPKQLRISLTVLGHDSERMTLSDEIT